MKVLLASFLILASVSSAKAADFLPRNLWPKVTQSVCFKGKVLFGERETVEVADCGQDDLCEEFDLPIEEDQVIYLQARCTDETKMTIIRKELY
jgi:hypothetical protein